MGPPRPGPLLNRPRGDKGSQPGKPSQANRVPKNRGRSGPYYDSAPAISPDGMSVAFISDRETLSQGNVFVLDVASGRIRRLTNELWVDRPAWSPDGKIIAFVARSILTRNSVPHSEVNASSRCSAAAVE